MALGSSVFVYLILEYCSVTCSISMYSVVWLFPKMTFCHCWVTQLLLYCPLSVATVKKHQSLKTQQPYLGLLQKQPLENRKSKVTLFSMSLSLFLSLYLSLFMSLCLYWFLEYICVDGCFQCCCFLSKNDTNTMKQAF